MQVRVDRLTGILGVACVLALIASVYARNARRPALATPPSGNSRRMTLLRSAQNDEVAEFESVARWQGAEDILIAVNVGSYCGSVGVLKSALRHNPAAPPDMLGAALSNAALFGYQDVAKLLLQREIPQKSRDDALARAAQNGHAEIVAALLDAKARANSTQSLRGDPAENMTPLMRAARYGRSDVVALLLSRHANPALKSSEGKTALQYALLKSGWKSPSDVPTRAASTMRLAQKRVNYDKTIRFLQ